MFTINIDGSSNGTGVGSNAMKTTIYKLILKHVSIYSQERILCNTTGMPPSVVHAKKNHFSFKKNETII